jgi:ketosteroid isomerase-like protein
MPSADVLQERLGRRTEPIARLFRHAFNLGDVEALIALYEPNAVLVVDGKDVVGRESIQGALAH